MFCSLDPPYLYLSSLQCYCFVINSRVHRAALTGKHDTLLRRPPGWQGAPDGQQAKKLVVTKPFFEIEFVCSVKNFLLLIIITFSTMQWCLQWQRHYPPLSPSKEMRSNISKPNVNSTGATRFMQSQHIIVPFRKVSCLVGFSPGFDEINFILPD